MDPSDEAELLSGMLNWQEEIHPLNKLPTDRVEISNGFQPLQELPQRFTSGPSLLDGPNWQTTSSNDSLLLDPFFNDVVQGGEDIPSLFNNTNIMDATFDPPTELENLPIAYPNQIQPNDLAFITTPTLNNILDLGTATEDTSVTCPIDWSMDSFLCEDEHTQPNLVRASGMSSDSNGEIGVQDLSNQIVPAGTLIGTLPDATVETLAQPDPFAMGSRFPSTSLGLLNPTKACDSTGIPNQELNAGLQTAHFIQAKRIIPDTIVTSQVRPPQITKVGPRLPAIQPRKDPNSATKSLRSLHSPSALTSRVSKTRQYSTKAAPHGCFLIEPAVKKNRRRVEPRSKKACFRCVVQKVKCDGRIPCTRCVETFERAKNLPLLTFTACFDSDICMLNFADSAELCFHGHSLKSELRVRARSKNTRLEKSFWDGHVIAYKSRLFTVGEALDFCYRREQKPFSEENRVWTRKITDHTLRWLKLLIPKALRNEISGIELVAFLMELGDVWVLVTELIHKCLVDSNHGVPGKESTHSLSALVHLRDYLTYCSHKCKIVDVLEQYMDYPGHTTLYLPVYGRIIEID